MMQRQIGSNAAELMLERIGKTREYSKAIRLKPGLVRRDSVRERGK